MIWSVLIEVLAIDVAVYCKAIPVDKESQLAGLCGKTW